MDRECETKDDGQKELIIKYAVSLFDDRLKRKTFLTVLAYNLFFYGTNVVDIEKVYTGQEEILLAYELHLQFMKLYFTPRENDTYKSLLKRITIPNEEEIRIEHYTAHYPMARGHNAQLGHYYRQMLQIVKYASESAPQMIDEKQKYNYVKLLRSQLCDAEQILLYYNSLSIMGKAWNEQHGADDDDIQTWGYILRFRLIKNIPSNYPFFGVTPIEYYKEKTHKWRQMFGEDFFENKTFTMFGNSL